MGTLLVAAAIMWVAAGLAWACTVRTVSAYYAESDPAVALSWDGHNPDALSEAAALKFSNARSPDDHFEVVRSARQALLAAPLDTRALRVLAFEADRVGQDNSARALMEVAGARTLRDTLTQSWLVDDSLRRHDYAAASLHADAILTRRDEFESTLFPVMIRSLEDPRAIGPFVALLAESPPWRRPFLQAAASQITDVSVAESVFEALKATKAPPTDEETAGLIDRLVTTGDYRAARAEWTRLLRGSPRNWNDLVYDGGFAALPGSPPFNWRLLSSDGAFAELVRTDDGRFALRCLGSQCQSNSAGRAAAGSRPRFLPALARGPTRCWRRN